MDDLKAMHYYFQERLDLGGSPELDFPAEFYKYREQLLESIEEILAEEKGNGKSRS